MEKELTPIVPDQKDIERAKKMYERDSRAQMDSHINRIKDPLKLARRWVAYAELSQFTHSNFDWHMQSLISTDSELYKRTIHTLKLIADKQKAKEEAKRIARKLAVAPAKEIIDRKVVDNVSEWNRNKVLNTLSLNKKYFGDEIRVNKVDIKFNDFLGWGEHAKVRVIISFEHLSGYFFRDLEYSLDLIIREMKDGTSQFVRNGLNHTPIIRLGKKDTKNLLELSKNL